MPNHARYHRQQITRRPPSPAGIAALWMILLASAVGIGGCTHLPGYFGTDATGPTIQPARVLCDNSSRRLLISARDDAETLTIIAVDQSSTLSYWDAIAQFEPYPSTLELPPGHHTLRIRYKDAVFYSEAELTLEAEAGATYRLQRQVIGLTARFWLVDAEGQQVGAIVSNALRNGNGNG